MRYGARSGRVRNGSGGGSAPDARADHHDVNHYHVGNANPHNDFYHFRAASTAATTARASAAAESDEATGHDHKGASLTATRG
jgi:hypothetical protein